MDVATFVKPKTATTLMSEKLAVERAAKVYAEKIAEQSYAAVCANLDAAVPRYTLHRHGNELTATMKFDIVHERGKMATFNRDHYFTTLNTLVQQRGFATLIFPKWSTLDTTQEYHFFGWGPFTETTARKRNVAAVLTYVVERAEILALE